MMKRFKPILMIVLICVVILLFKKLQGTRIQDLFKLANSSKNNIAATIEDKDAMSGSNRNNIVAEAAVAVDAESGKVLYSKNPDGRMYPASTTKLMTALITSEKLNRKSIMNYSRNAKAQEASHMNFPIGTKMNAENVMEAMLVYSANDMAYMAGENVSGSTDSFVKLMNKKAKELGMENTHFENTNGLHNFNHYTTARDMSKLARAVYKSDWIMSILKMPSTDIHTKNGNSVEVYNTNKLLGQDGCFAGKTGYTSEAGRCLVAYFKKNGKTIIGVVFKSPTDNLLYSDMKKLINNAI